MPPALWPLNFNPKSGFYEIEEAGFLYRMNLEETRELRNYFRHFNHCGGTEFPTVAGWYSFIDSNTRKKVIREGNILVPKLAVDGFYPDQEWTE